MFVNVYVESSFKFSQTVYFHRNQTEYDMPKHKQNDRFTNNIA